MTNKIPEYTPEETLTEEVLLRPFAIFRQLLNANEVEEKVGKQARQLCHDVFQKRTSINGEESWQINYKKRALTPNAVTKDSDEVPLIASMLAKSALGRILAPFKPPKATFGGGRLRYQPPDHINHALHQDTYFLRNTSFFTFWTPVIEQGKKTGIDTPGLEIFTAPVNQELGVNPDDPWSISLTELRKFQTSKSLYGDCVRPQLETGDVLIFREIIPHGSYIPKGCSHPRTSFDFRLPLNFETAFIPKTLQDLQKWKMENVSQLSYLKFFG